MFFSSVGLVEINNVSFLILPMETKTCVSIAEKATSREQIEQKGELIANLADAESELDAKNAEVNQLQTNVKHLSEANQVKAKEQEELRKELENTKLKIESLSKVANETSTKLCAKEEEVKVLQKQISEENDAKVADKAMEVANLQSTIAGIYISGLSKI